MSKQIDPDNYVTSLNKEGVNEYITFDLLSKVMIVEIIVTKFIKSDFYIVDVNVQINFNQVMRIQKKDHRSGFKSKIYKRFNGVEKDIIKAGLTDRKIIVKFNDN